MLKCGAMLLLLAAASHQFTDMFPPGDISLSSCRLTFYGRTYTGLEVSFKDSAVAFCFKNSQIPQDCIFLKDRLDIDTVRYRFDTSPLSPGSSLHIALPSITGASSCYLSMIMTSPTSGGTVVTLALFNFGSQLAAAVDATGSYSSPYVNVSTMFGTSTVDSWSYPKLEAQRSPYMDFSGCRVGDRPYKIGQSEDPETCTKVICDVSGSSVTTCGAKEVCLGNNTCFQPTVCTVTGSTVIDFFGRVHSVPDRCAYTLMTHGGNDGFSLEAGFRERRRRDVTFLDNLLLKLNGPNVKIYLEQGGRVRVDGQMLSLSSASRLVHGVELSKDQTGVTAKIPSANAKIFFDGNTAHVEGLIEGAQGLCGNPSNSSQTTTLRAEKNISPGCDTQYKDMADSTVNCNQTTEHCNLLRQAPFTACHSVVDPEPFRTACTNTLCEYPAVDDLKCQFLEAYAKSCSLKDVPLEDWRSKASCSPAPQAFCQDQYCSTHEFCGEKFGDTRCLCRAIFASKYKRTDTLGEPTVCVQNSATVTLAGCLLEEKGIDYTALHLKDENCTGRMDNETHMVAFSFDASSICGTDVVTNDTQIVYKNAIMTTNSSGNSIITRRDQFVIDFSCYYTKPEVQSVSFKIKDSSVVQKIVSGVWNYTLTMNAYTDSGRTNFVGPATEVKLDQKIWVELKTEGLDDKMVAVVTDSCWATAQESPDGSPRYDLIINGCPNPADQAVKVTGNGLGTSNFLSFNMFEFTGQHSEIYLHCKLELCITQGNVCAPTCGGVGSRKRRSFRTRHADPSPALITMAWSHYSSPTD